jgi:hypothetical protein
MGFLGFLVDKVASTIDSLVSILPSFNFDSTPIGQAVNTITPYLNVANRILPLSETAIVLGILCAFSICMAAFYVIQRALNLLRGAG